MKRRTKTYTFEIYPYDKNDGGRFFAVHVFPNRRAMLRKYKRISDGAKIPYRFGACVMPLRIENFDAAGRRELRPFLGHVLFSPPHITAEVIAHEAVHMATTYIRRIRKSLRLREDVEDNEERLAYYTGRCAAKITNKLHELGIWK